MSLLWVQLSQPVARPPGDPRVLKALRVSEEIRVDRGRLPRMPRF